MIQTVDERALELFVKPNVPPLLLVDGSGSEWDFSGKAVSGALAGKQLKKIALLGLLV